MNSYGIIYLFRARQEGDGNVQSIYFSFMGKNVIYISDKLNGFYLKFYIKIDYLYLVNVT